MVLVHVLVLVSVLVLVGGLEHTRNFSLMTRFLCDFTEKSFLGGTGTAGDIVVCSNYRVSFRSRLEFQTIDLGDIFDFTEKSL